MIHWHFKKEPHWPPLADRAWVARRIDILIAHEYYVCAQPMITEEHVIVHTYEEWLEQLENGHKR